MTSVRRQQVFLDVAKMRKKLLVPTLCDILYPTSLEPSPPVRIVLFKMHQVTKTH